MEESGNFLGQRDMPMDMMMLLQKLEEDFANKTIDQWTYINRREEIMKQVQRTRAAAAADVTSNGQLEPVLLPRSKPDYEQFARHSMVRILRERAELYKQEPAIIVLDGKGKEQQQMTWEKVFLKAAKVASELRHRHGVKPNDTVGLLYKDGEVCEFAVALYGCFMARATAIPIHQDVSLAEMFDVVALSGSHVVLLSESVAKELERLAATSSAVQWPAKVMRVRTTDLGSAKKSDLENVFGKSAKKDEHLDDHDLAYVEYSRSPVGELRGIAVRHQTILHQMHSLDVSLSSPPDAGALRHALNSPRRARKVFLATLDLRLSIGLIVGVLFTVYTGNLLAWAPPKVMEVQGLYAHLISRLRANLLLADFLGLKRVVYDYQSSPNTTRYFSKTQRVDFSPVKWVLINALTVDGELIEVLTERYLKPLGCTQPQQAIVPMLTLSEYGGMVVSMRDWVGFGDKLGLGPNFRTSADMSSVAIEKEALSRNKVRVVATDGSETEDHSGTLRVDAFGYPLVDATLAVVNPDTQTLVLKGELGELWIDSPSLAHGFFSLRAESRQIFRARCRDAQGPLDNEFLRTGLLGFTYNGKVYVLGLYEDRIRQRVSWLDVKMSRKPISPTHPTRFHYSSHLLATLASEVRQVYDCTIFDVFIGNEYLPVAIVEAEVVRKVLDESETAKSRYDYSSVPLNEPQLHAVAQKCFDTLHKHHKLRLYCVVVVDCDTLPKIMRSGGMEIANMLCKKRFFEGSLKAEFVKFFVRQSISMVPHGEDVLGGIWSPYASELRAASLSRFSPQISAVDLRDKSLDEKTGAPLTDFKSIVDILKLRVAHTPDAVAFQTTDTGKSSSKPLTWRKFELRVYAVCSYLIEKSQLKPGQHVVLMYSLSEEFAIAVFACFTLGVVPVPMLPFDSNRIGEDFPAFVGVVKDFAIEEVLVNDDVERYMKNGPVADALKKMNHRRQRPLRVKNTSKLSKVGNTAAINSKIAKYQADSRFRDLSTTCLVWLNFTSDHYRVGACLTHRNIVSLCKVFKETCNLSSKSPVVGCVRHSSGIGFVQAVLLGCFLGTPTLLCSPVKFAENPLAFFLALAKHKVKDVFVTEQMLKYAVTRFTPKGFSLAELKNMMISTESRVEVDLLRKFASVFQPAKLSAAAMSAVYTCCFNPIVSTRSYMTVAPVDLYLDPVALRQGFVSIVNPGEMPAALRVQDSGMVPVCTEIAIVNPETCRVCREGEFGEIWVNSEANLAGFTNGPHGPQDHFSPTQFAGKIVGGNPDVTYLRTGDLGFLHHISISKNGSQSDTTSFQPLFVLGKISDTFEVMGLHHFPMDIEATIESCHPDMYKNGSCIFKCSDFTIAVCESKRTKNLSALVPLIVNSVFSKHHLVVDIVSFIKKGEFPISRLGTKQRARIVDAWVQRIIPIRVSYGVNYGENSMIKLIKEIDEVARDDPVIGLKNPAQSYYDEDFGEPLALNPN